MDAVIWGSGSKDLWNTYPGYRPWRLHLKKSVCGSNLEKNCQIGINTLTGNTGGVEMLEPSPFAKLEADLPVPP